MHTFQDVNGTIRKYAQVVGDNRKTLDSLGPEPQLSDFYIPTDDQKDREIAFVILGMGVTMLVAYKLTT